MALSLLALATLTAAFAAAPEPPAPPSPDQALASVRSRVLHAQIAEALAVADGLVADAPEHPDAPLALAEGGRLCLALGDVVGAASRWEAVGERYPSRAEGEALGLRAAEVLAEQDAGAALSSYDRWLRRYPNASPERLASARLGIAVLIARQGDPIETARAWKNFERAAARVPDAPGQQSASLALDGALAKVREAVALFLRQGWSGDGLVDAARIPALKREAEALDAEAVQLARDHARDPDLAVAGPTLGGLALRHAGALLAAPPALAGLPEADRRAALQAAASASPSLAARGEARLRFAVERAGALGLATPWSLRAAAALDPSTRPGWRDPLPRPAEAEAAAAGAVGVLAVAPHDLSAWNRVGRAWLAAGQPERARTWFEWALSTVPGAAQDAALQCGLAGALWSLDRITAARATLVALQQRAPDVACGPEG